MTRFEKAPEPRSPTTILGCKVVIKIAKQEIPLPLDVDEMQKGRAVVDLEEVAKEIQRFREQGVDIEPEAS